MSEKDSNSQQIRGHVRSSEVSANSEKLAMTSEIFRLEKSADAMGSTFSIILYGCDRRSLELAVDAAFEEVRRLDELLSNYRPDSEWSRINQQAAESAARLSPELFQLLASCQEYSRQSEGAFDITVGPLMKSWGFFKGTGRLPDAAEVRAALASVGYRHLRLDPAAQTVRFDCSGMEINSGGIGKGYAIDCMIHILRERGVDTALVSASGSSIYGMGTPPSETQGWRVPICDPRNPRRLATEVFLQDRSMSTSGSYEKSFHADGRTYCHIMDPRTGYPAQGRLLVSVIAPGALDSEVWTKPCFINGRQWMERHRPRQIRAFVFESGTEEAGTWLR
jgi:thiamine biosynthesis lipoprotein